MEAKKSTVPSNHISLILMYPGYPMLSPIPSLSLRFFFFFLEGPGSQVRKERHNLRRAQRWMRPASSPRIFFWTLKVKRSTNSRFWNHITIIITGFSDWFYKPTETFGHVSDKSGLRRLDLLAWHNMTWQNRTAMVTWAICKDRVPSFFSW